MWSKEEGEEEHQPITGSNNYKSISYSKSIESISITSSSGNSKSGNSGNKDKMSAYSAIYPEDLSGGSLYYSDLPVRSHLQKDKFKFYGRKIIYYLFLAYFIAAIYKFPVLITNLTFWSWLIVLCYFETDVSSNKNNIFIQILHPLSFVLSFVVFITSVILLIILNPDFIANRAKQEGNSVAFGWAMNILIHWVPPVLMTIDLFLHKEHVRKRHHILLTKRNTVKHWVKDILKVTWAITSPMILVAIWFAFFTIQEVYQVTNYNLAYLIPSMCVVDIIVALFFLFIIRKRNPDSFVRLNN